MPLIKRTTTEPVAPKQPIMARLKNSIHKSEAKVSSKVHKPMLARTTVNGEAKPKRLGLRQHRLNKKQAKLPKQNIGIIGRVKLLLNRLMNFAKGSTHKMIAPAPAAQPIRYNVKQY